MRLRLCAGLLLLGIVVSSPSHAQTVTATIPTNFSPLVMAVNPVTNKIYIPDASANSLVILDGLSNTMTTLATGASPGAVEVNPVTNIIYVANSFSNNVTVIDGATNATSPIPVGVGPRAVVVNSVTNKAGAAIRSP